MKSQHKSDHPFTVFKSASLIFFSFIIPGFTHAYVGEYARGMFFLGAIVFFMLMIPFKIIVHPEHSSLVHAFVMTAICATVYVLCIIDTVRIVATKHFHKKKANFRSRIIFSVTAIFSITLSASFVRLVYFFEIVPNDAMQPTFFKNEIILATKYYTKIASGDVVIYFDGTKKHIGRIVALENNKIRSFSGKIEINGIPLSIGIMLSDEILRRDLPFSDTLLYEVQGNRKYPVNMVLSKRETFIQKKQIAVPSQHCAIASDDRTTKEEPNIIPVKTIFGRVEGIVWGKSWKRFLLAPFDIL